MQYKPYSGSDALNKLGYGSRTFFGCEAYYDANGNPDPLIPCPIQLFLAIFISFILIAGLVMETGYTGPSGLAIMFCITLGIFTYFTWIPYVLYGIMVAATIGVIIFSKGRF